jgi:hypothetical protein
MLEVFNPSVIAGAGVMLVDTSGMMIAGGSRKAPEVEQVR